MKRLRRPGSFIYSIPAMVRLYTLYIQFDFINKPARRAALYTGI